MTKRQLIAAAMEALRKKREIPPEIRAQRLIDRGVIDERGNVLLGLTREQQIELYGEQHS